MSTFELIMVMWFCFLIGYITPLMLELHKLNKKIDRMTKEG